MKHLCVLGFILLLAITSHAVQDAKIVGDAVEIYSEADFDSPVIDEVYKDESYKISSKIYGPFYRIKLKSGKVGYIVDYELNINGKGPFVEKDLDEMELKGAMEAQPPPLNDEQAEAEDQEVFGKNYSGFVLQLYNYHEDTMGSVQVDELVAIGYKSIKTLSWSVVGTTQIPKYYTDPPGNSAKGLKLWADVGFSNEIGQFTSAALRFSGNIFTHISVIQLNTPARNYDLQDITAGINLEVGLIKKFHSFATDLSIKYYFDKSNYAAVGVGVLF